MANSFWCFQKSKRSEDYLLNASRTVCLSCFGKIDSIDFQALVHRHSPDCLVIYSHCRAIKTILLLQGRILQIQIFRIFFWSLHRSTSSQSRKGEYKDIAVTDSLTYGGSDQSRHPFALHTLCGALAFLVLETIMYMSFTKAEHQLYSSYSYEAGSVKIV